MMTRDDLGEDGFADSGGVKIHYVTKGTGPLIILIHGIPDFWYSWRNQIPALAEHFQVVAIDQRGFNLSDQPGGVESYTLDKLAGHDSGGWIGWRYAMTHPGCRERDLTPELYASGFKDEQPRYLEALQRTSIEGIINFYKANYPRPPYKEETYPPVKCPVLMIHGLDDMWLMPEALNDTWRYLE